MIVGTRARESVALLACVLGTWVSLGACGGDPAASGSGGSGGASSSGATTSGGGTSAIGGGGSGGFGAAGGGGFGAAGGAGGGGVGGGAGGIGVGGAGGQGGGGGQGGLGGATSASATATGVGGASSSSMGAGGASSSSSSGAGGGGSVRVRIVTANTTTGNNQSYDPGQGIRIFEGLHPDIALVQEFNYGDDSPTAIRGMVDTAFGPTFGYQREATVGIPNGVVSRYPILAGGTFTDPDVTNRSFVWAHIDVPGPRDLWAVSVHLLTSDATVRSTEATALLSDLQTLVPAGDFLVIGGDFNTKVRDEPCILTLAQIVDTAAPYPVDNFGNDKTNGPRSHAYDWVMPNAPLRALETGVIIGAQTFPNGLVLDSRVYTPLVDVAPVMVNDSDDAAPNNMQHMAVVKDFVLPE